MRWVGEHIATGCSHGLPLPAKPWLLNDSTPRKRSQRHVRSQACHHLWRLGISGPADRAGHGKRRAGASASPSAAPMNRVSCAPMAPRPDRAGPLQRPRRPVGSAPAWPMPMPSLRGHSGARGQEHLDAIHEEAAGRIARIAAETGIQSISSTSRRWGDAASPAITPPEGPGRGFGAATPPGCAAILRLDHLWLGRPFL